MPKQSKNITLYDLLQLMRITISNPENITLITAPH